MTHTAEQEREAVVRWLDWSSEKFSPNERAKVRDVFLAMMTTIKRGDHIKKD